MSDQKSNFERRKEELAQKVQELVQNNEAKESKTESEAKSLDSSHQESETLSTSPELSETEKQARALGWKSKEERLSEGKNNNHFVDADEYVRRQPLFERIDRYGKEIRDLRQMNQQIADHLSSVRKDAYQQALQELENQKIEAINDADKAKVFSTETEMATLRNKMSTDPLIQPQVRQESAPVQAQPKQDFHPDTSAFIERNKSWYNDQTPENRVMIEAAYQAQQLELALAQEKGQNLSPKEIMEKVEHRVRINFPHRFENPKKDSPSLVGRSTINKEETKTNSLINKMTPEQRRMGEYFMRSNPNYTLDKYAADLEKIGRLQ